MRQTTVARVYAETLFDLAKGREAVDRTAGEVQVLQEALRASRLRRFLESPRVAGEEKKQVLRRSLGGRLSEETLRFLELVLEKGRGDLLDEILSEFGVLADKLRNRQTLEVASAVPLPDPLRERLRETFARATGSEILLHERLDPSLVAGIVVQLGDSRIDGSVRTRLENLRERMRRAVAEHAQPSRSAGAPGAAP